MAKDQKIGPTHRPEDPQRIHVFPLLEAASTLRLPKNQETPVKLKKLFINKDNPNPNFVIAIFTFSLYHITLEVLEFEMSTRSQEVTVKIICRKTLQKL